MADLIICTSCNHTWSLTFDPYDAPILMKYVWCPTCRDNRHLGFIGEIPGVMKPPAYFGSTPPPAPPVSAPLLLTYEPQAQVQPAVQPPQGTGAVNRQPNVNVLPASSQVIVLDQSDNMRDVTFRQHVQGQPITVPPKSLLDKYFTSTADKSLVDTANYYDSNVPSKIYVRFLAIFMIEIEKKTRIQITNPKGSAYGASPLQRDLAGTLTRIAKGESIAKTLNNAAYNNDGMASTNKISYDRYGRNYKGTRTGSDTLPSPSDTNGLPDRYWEFYVDRDGVKGASPLSIGGGKPGIERLWMQVPDYIFYTWNHYGSDVPFGPVRSALTDVDIWAVYSFNSHAWQRGLTRT